MANCRMMNFQPLPDGAAYCFYQVDPNVLSQDVATFFQGMQYKFEGGTPFDSNWGQGSNTMRILFGAFAKRYAFNVKIEPQPDAPGYVWVRLSKGMSGAMGGVIGYSKMNTETQRLIAAMQHFFST
jgi:hypothetical protein